SLQLHFPLWRIRLHPCVRHSFYDWLNWGSLFSMKASIPSLASSVKNNSANCFLSLDKPLSNVSLYPFITHSTARFTLVILFPSTRDLAIDNAVGNSSSEETVVCTIPSVCASLLLICLPVKIRSNAVVLLVMRLSLCVPPKDGINPSFNSGSPRMACSEAIRK